MFTSVWERFEVAAPVDEVGRIEEWLFNSGNSETSVAVLREDIPRWPKRKREIGVVVHVPLTPWLAGPKDAPAVDLLDLFMLQASPRKDRIAKALRHHLRNRTGTRPYKP